MKKCLIELLFVLEIILGIAELFVMSYIISNQLIYMIIIYILSFSITYLVIELYEYEKDWRN